MILPTKYNILLATIGYHVISLCRRLVGESDIAEVSRGGLQWVLDLREGIDLTIFALGYFQRSTVKVCKQLLGPGCVAMDVGANMGALSLHMATSVEANGLVIAVEPTSYPLSRLRKNLKVNGFLGSRVKTVQAFLTSSAQQDIPEFVQSSWRLSGDRTGAHPVHYGVPQDTRGAVSITLDQLVKELNLERLDLIKIDVDGSEDTVLAGGEESLVRFRPNIVIEVAPYTLIERGIPGDSPLQRLKRLGYVFEDLHGKNLESDNFDWVKQFGEGYSIDIVAKFRETIQD